MIQFNALEIVSMEVCSPDFSKWEYYKKRFPKWLQFLEKEEGWYLKEDYEICFPDKPKECLVICFSDGQVIRHYEEDVIKIEEVRNYVHHCITKGRDVRSNCNGMFKYVNGRVVTWK